MQCFFLQSMVKVGWFNGAEKWTSSKSTFRTYTKSTNQILISEPNEGGMRGTNSKNWKTQQKNNVLWSYWEGEGVHRVWNVDIIKMRIWDLYWIYIPNFNFSAQLGGELCEEQTRKIRKTDEYIFGFEKLNLSKSTVIAPTTSTYQILSS